MIKNIVFDLGNVLVKFKPRQFLNDLFTDENVIDFLFDFYFQSGLWNQYDQGLFTKEGMIDQGQQVHPEYKDEIVQMMNRWVEYVVEVESSIQVLEKYKGHFSLYVLSNVPEDYYQYVIENLSIFKYMDGGIYSYQEKIIKPDTRIYRRLLEKYNLQADECLFIDDKLENIEKANELGFYTIHLKELSELENELKVMLDEM